MSQDEKDYLLSVIINKKVNMYLLYCCKNLKEYNDAINTSDRKLTIDEFMKVRKVVRP